MKMPFWRAAGYTSWLEYAQRWLEENHPGVRISYSRRYMRYVFEDDEGRRHSVPRLVFSDCFYNQKNTQHSLALAVKRLLNNAPGEGATE